VRERNPPLEHDRKGTDMATTITSGRITEENRGLDVWLGGDGTCQGCGNAATLTILNVETTDPRRMNSSLPRNVRVCVPCLPEVQRIRDDLERIAVAAMVSRSRDKRERAAYTASRIADAGALVRRLQKVVPA